MAIGSEDGGGGGSEAEESGKQAGKIVLVGRDGKVGFVSRACSVGSAGDRVPARSSNKSRRNCRDCLCRALKSPVFHRRASNLARIAHSLIKVTSCVVARNAIVSAVIIGRELINIACQLGNGLFYDSELPAYTRAEITIFIRFREGLYRNTPTSEKSIIVYATHAPRLPVVRVGKRA